MQFFLHVAATGSTQSSHSLAAQGAARMRIGCLAVVVAFTTAVPAGANELRIETRGITRSEEAGTLRVAATVRWANAWRNARNHDAVWLVVKLRGEGDDEWSHGRLRAIAVGDSSPDATCRVSADAIGAFCAATAEYRGAVDCEISFDVETGELDDDDVSGGTVEALVFGVEMVYIPGGPFTIGDPDPSSVESIAFYRSDRHGNHAGTFRITSEATIDVGPREGALYYAASEYGGDRLGPVPGAFPKGTRAFYGMKYEILQGQYATFLNTIHPNASSFRAPIGGRGYHQERGSIRLVNGLYVAGSPDRPANWMSWDDGAAFADWAGLRPWTELEFTKAARGPVEPIAGDFPWGTASKDRLVRRNQPDDELAQTGAANEADLTDGTRPVLGASYYWVMDLAGSVWEKVVSIGHPAGRAFRGTHGDGELRSYGLATNEDWPQGDHYGGGYGYRGGGYYLRGSAETALNPHSRVAHRPYGAWGGGPRGVAYGFRAARTVDR